MPNIGSKMKKIVLINLFLLLTSGAFSQSTVWKGKFEQLEYLLPTPNEYRNGAGAPGSKYWQQNVDYQIDVTLDENTKSIQGQEIITYHNNSPIALDYLWIQLDQNIRKNNSKIELSTSDNVEEISTTKKAAKKLHLDGFNGGLNIELVSTMDETPLNYVINETMMKIDLTDPIQSGESFNFKIKWNYTLQDRMIYGGRSGLEYFPEDDNYIFAVGQFYPRLCVFDDVEGWQNKQFTGVSEFALEFGKFEVNITVPDDYIVAATGVLSNKKDVLSKSQIERLAIASNSFDKPIHIIKENEAIENEKTKSAGLKTWTFNANKVRDFAFAASRKFIWEAQAVKTGEKNTLAMSYYPKEANPLWELEALKAVKNALEFYSETCFEYPYPVAQVVSCASLAMEYPMISFDWGRARPDGSYTETTKFNMVESIIHEIGHNYFPMIINSDERKYEWFDEGINTFLENRAKTAKYDTFPPSKGEIPSIINYMATGINQPIMTSVDQIKSEGFVNYYKTAAAFVMLRELVMGPELFDTAFKEYCKRWAFKHPKPADFFRTMEDASAVDLDWFWRGWFYSSDYVDLSIENVTWYKLNAENKSKKDIQTDFSEGPRSFNLKNTPMSHYKEFYNTVDDEGIMKKFDGKNLYEINFKNIGGLVMPLLLEFTFADNSKIRMNIPAEIWRLNEQETMKVFVFEKEVINIVLDPDGMTSDTNTLNNVFPKFGEGNIKPSGSY